MSSSRLPQDARLDRRDLVAPPQLDVRVEASWAAIAARVPAGRSVRARKTPWLASGFALAAGALLLAWALLPPDHKDTSAPVVATLPAARPLEQAVDEPRVKASLDAELTLLEEAPRETRYRLRRGRATFAALDQRAKPLLVHVDDVRVHIASSRVTVLGFSAGHPYVEVFVETGSAVVEFGEERKVLQQGETFRRQRAKPAARSEPKNEKPAGASPPKVDPAHVRLARASEARRLGRFEESAREYEALLDAFPADPRSPLAALELGRLRADQLSDLPRAIVALERAARGDAPATIREDAMARLVAAHDQRGDRARCEAARARYRTAFPHGLHTAEVEQRCSVPP